MDFTRSETQTLVSNAVMHRVLYTANIIHTGIYKTLKVNSRLIIAVILNAVHTLMIMMMTMTQHSYSEVHTSHKCLMYKYYI